MLDEGRNEGGTARAPDDARRRRAYVRSNALTP